ncbi:MAG: class I SAM-dependent methyltransferase [Candidatus Hermodarchaeota archaeon]
MASTIRAYRQLIRMGNFYIVRQFEGFFKGNIIRVFTKEGLFDFLDEPKTLNEVSEHFGYTNQLFLKKLFDFLAEDTIIRLYEEKYQTVRPIKDVWVRPEVFNDSAIEIWEEYAHSIPSKLKGMSKEFISGINLFRWDDMLNSEVFGGIRRLAFVFANPFKRSGKILDFRCGNGFTTTGIWNDYYQRNYFSPKSDVKIEIVGVDSATDLLKIAQEEFQLMAANISGDPVEKIRELESYFPKFVEGELTALPFEDNTFDMVFSSQTLQWTDPKKALREMVRVTKPGGMIFGVQSLLPNQKYWFLHIEVIEGAHGSFTKEELVQWIKEAGGTNIKFSTPVTVFKFDKRTK